MRLQIADATAGFATRLKKFNTELSICTAFATGKAHVRTSSNYCNTQTGTFEMINLIVHHLPLEDHPWKTTSSNRSSPTAAAACAVANVKEEEVLCLAFGLATRWAEVAGAVASLVEESLK